MRIEISTHSGRVFKGDASSIVFRSGTGTCVEIQPGQVQYVNLIREGEITLVVDRQTIAFLVSHASASFTKGLLTVLAKTASRLDDVG